jgi:phosphatidylethanolamine/phosphatidyl-N-methylethanolamine N-methyltransferase
MPVQYDLEGQKAAYRIWARFYDMVYRRLLYPAQKATVDAALACGPDILEIGVGTGLSLPYYPAHARVVGSDLSEDMLRKAQDKVREGDLSHVKLLTAMDATRLGFADASFDAVTAQFVITLVPSPETALDEMARVLRPGGEIVVASRLGAEGGFQARLEEAIAPLVKLVGWSSTFRLSRLAAWAKRHGGFEVVHVKKGFYFTVVRMKKAA